MNDIDQFLADVYQHTPVYHTECWTLRTFVPFFNSLPIAHHFVYTATFENPPLNISYRFLWKPGTATSVGAPVNSSKASEVSPPLMKR